MGKWSNFIKYSSKNREKALLVAQHINGNLVMDSSITGADVTVVLGEDFEAVSKKASPNKANNSSSNVATTTVAKTQENDSGIDDSVDCPA